MNEWVEKHSQLKNYFCPQVILDLRYFHLFVWPIGQNDYYNSPWKWWQSLVPMDSFTPLIEKNLTLNLCLKNIKPQRVNKFYMNMQTLALLNFFLTPFIWSKVFLSYISKA